MTARLANNAASKLQNAVRAEDTILTIASQDADLFPSISGGDWFPLNITAADGAYEIVHVTARDNNILTVKRGCENTKAQAFAAGSHVDIRLTSEAVESFLGLYYGARTTPPENVPIGALYLDISETPNRTKVFTEYGWELTTAIWYGKQVQHSFDSGGALGPYGLPSDVFKTDFYITVGGKVLYPGLDFSIDYKDNSITLFKAPLGNDRIVIHANERVPTEEIITRPIYHAKLQDLDQIIGMFSQWLLEQILNLGGSFPEFNSLAYSPNIATANMVAGAEGNGYSGSPAPMHTQAFSTMALNDKAIDTDDTPTPPTKSELLTKLAQLRWQVETNGIDIDGLHISTDQSSQIRMQKARLAADNDPDFTFQWKTPDGFVTLDTTRITMISNAIITHMVACLACEAKLTADIEKGEITDFDQLEVHFQSCIEECLHAG